MSQHVKRLWTNTSKEVCDGFGKALASGQSPNIEEYLSRITDSDRSAAFYGLLTREVDFLEATGRPIEGDAYRKHFPGEREIVDSVLFRDEHLKELLQECGYAFIAKLATQRTGDVYKVRNVETGSNEALTRIPSFMLNRNAREGHGFDFAYMDYSGIARPTNVIQAHADILIATEFVEGLDFSNLVEGSAVTVDSAAELVRQSAEAVAWLHAHGHVHGTLSPTSLLLSTDSNGLPLVKLCGAPFYQLADASLSRFRAPNLQEFNWKTFVPPESLEDIQAIEPSGDVFSLGQTFLYLVSKNPNRSFVRSSDWASTCLEEFRQRPPDDSSPLRVRQWQQLADLIASAVAEDPEKRPSAETLARNLAEFSGPVRLDRISSAAPRQVAHHPFKRQTAASVSNRSDSASKSSTATKSLATATSEASPRKRLSKSTLAGVAIGSVLVLRLLLEVFHFFNPGGDDRLAMEAEKHLVANAVVDSEASHPEISTTAVTAADTTQARGDRRVRPTAAEEVRKPDLYMLTIGVSQYRDAQYNLSVADSDAQVLAETFDESESGIFGNVAIHTLTNEQADKNGILQELKWLQSEATQHDLAIVTVSGHGVTDEFDDFFFLPYDYDASKAMAFSAVSWDDIHRWLARMPCNIWLVMDACHSGGVTRIGTRGLRQLEMERATKRALLAFSESPKGMVIMAASLGQQSALEKSEWGHGALTLALLEGLTGKPLTASQHDTPLPSELNDDGIVSLGDLSHYATKRVKELTDGKQAVVTNHSGNIDIDAIPLRTIVPPEN